MTARWITAIVAALSAAGLIFALAGPASAATHHSASVHPAPQVLKEGQ